MAHRVKIVHNPNYKRNGLKSYAWLLKKYNIAPSLEGPFYMGSRIHHQGKYGPGGLHEPHQHGEHHEHHEHHEHERHPQHEQELQEQPPQRPIGGRTSVRHILMKRADAATGGSGEVTAEDIQTDSEYLCPVSIGTPAQTLLLDFDTGSSDLWCWSTELDAKTIQQGRQTKHNIFNPAKSSTFNKVSGSTWKIQYGDQSSASGDVGTDTVKIGSITIANQAIELAKQMSSQFVQGAGDGLLGLAWGNINTVKPTRVQTPVENMISEQDIPASAELFTARLGSWRDANDPDKGESFYTFGELDAATVQQYGQPAYTPVDNSQGFWMFASESWSLNGKTTARSANKAIADTGTTLLLTDDAVCKALYAAIPGAKYDSDQQGYLFPASTSADDLPDVAFPCGDSMIAVQKEDLAFADAGNGMVYGGIQSNGSLGFDIFGDTWLKSAYVVFDQGNTRIGVVQRSEPTQNLEPPPAQAS